MAAGREPKSIFDRDGVGEVEGLYFAMVDRAWRNRENSLISNGRAVHAIYLLYTLIANAKSEIRLLTGTLAHTLEEDGGTYRAFGDPAIIDAASGFVARGGAMRILFTDPVADPGGHPFVSRIVEQVPDGGLALARTGEEWSAKDPHFMVMDEDAYRFDDAGSRQVLANFGDRKLSRELAKLFDVMWRGGRPIPLNAAA